MKKIISIMLIITMLLSMVAITVPAVATEGTGGVVTGTVPTLSELGIDIATGVDTSLLLGAEDVGAVVPSAPTKPSVTTVTASDFTMPTVPAKPAASTTVDITHVGTDGADVAAGKLTIVDGKATNVGNVVIAKLTAAQRQEYINKLIDDGYTPVANAATREGKSYDSWLKEGVTPILYSSMVDGGKYCLIEDITWSSCVGEGACQKMGDKDGFMDDWTLDGCGYTITVPDSSLYDKTNNITVKNVTFDGTITADYDRYYHIFNRWSSSGYVNLTNVTASVDFEIKNTDSDKTSGVFTYTMSGSTWKNVLNEGKVEIKSGTTRLTAIGGLVGRSYSGGNLYSVVNMGDIIVDCASIGSDYVFEDIGGIAGTAYGGSFNDCYNGGSITIKNMNSRSVGYIGGLIGKEEGSVAINDCVSAGAISVSGTGATTPGVGGIVGKSLGSVTDSINLANITIAANADHVGGIAAVKVNNTISGCTNAGKITVAPASGTVKVCAVGGIVGAGAASQDGWANNNFNCVNHGDIELNSTNGAILMGYAHTIETGDNDCGHNTVGGGIGGIQGVGGVMDGNKNAIGGSISQTGTYYSNCINTGDITLKGSSSNESRVGSIGGIYGIHVQGHVKYDHGESRSQYLYNEGNITVESGFYKAVSNGSLISTWYWANIGGIMGYQKWNTNATTRINRGTITISSADAQFHGVGGICGRTDNGNKFDGSYNSPLAADGVSINVTAGYANSVGGILGLDSEYNIVSYNKNAYNLGDIKIGGSASAVYCGGIAGYTGSIIENAINSGDIEISANVSYVGGIAGYTNGSKDNDDRDGDGNKNEWTGVIKNAKNTGNITVGPANNIAVAAIGGIVGRGFNNANKNCENSGNIKVDVTKGINMLVETVNNTKVYGGIGGIQGYGGSRSGSAATTYTDCVNTGNIEITATAKASTGNFGHIGGIFGGHDKGQSTVNGSIYNSGDISVTGSTFVSNDPYVGGIFGWTSYGITVKNAVNRGSVTISGANANMGHIGGIGAFSSNNQVTENCINYPDAEDGVFLRVTAGDVDDVGGILAQVACPQNTTTVSYAKGHVNVGDIVIEGGSAGSIGGIAGYSRTTIDGSINDGSITVGSGVSVSYVGGILGLAEGYNSGAARYTDITNCHNGLNGDITINGTSGAHVGGIVGETKADVGHCYNAGDITVNGKVNGSLGGIVGKVVGLRLGDGTEAKPYVYAEAMIDRCTNAGNITIGAESTVTDSASEGHGGIVGLASNGGYSGDAGIVIVKDCLNKGSVTVNKYLQRTTAGIVAMNTARNITIFNCLNEGAVTSKSGHTGDHTQTAGILGLTYNSVSREIAMKRSVEVTNCTNLGVISDSNTDKKTNEETGKYTVSQVAGIVANIRGIPNVTISNCVNGSSEAVAEDAVAPGTIKGGIADGGWAGVAGILGFYGTVGKAWLMDNKQEDPGVKLTVEKVINYAPVSGNSGIVVGSLFGAIGTQETALSHADSKLLFKDCVNAAEFTASAWAVGGVMNDVNHAFMEFVECANIGKVAPTSSAQRSGGLFGAVRKAINVTGCVNAGEVVPPTNTQHQFMGGIVGSTEAAVKLTDCVNTANLAPTGKGYDSGGGDGDQGVGGIVGYHSYSSKIVLSGCENYGKIYQTGMPSVYGIGGIIGTIWKDGTADIIDCTNYGTIEIDNIHGTVSGVHGGVSHGIDTDNGRQAAQGAGGIIGSARWNTKVNVDGCVNKGLITITEDGGYYNMGGIVGSVYKNTTGYFNVTDCHNEGEVRIDSTKGSEMHGAAGIMGRMIKCTTATIESCTNNGKISVTEEAHDYNLAGILASANHSKLRVVDCHNLKGGDIVIRDTKLVDVAYSYNAAAGVVAYIYSNGMPTDEDAVIESCSNEASISNYGDGYTAWVGGITAIIRSTSSAELVNCVNTGDVTSIKGLTGGMISWTGTVGLSWANQDTSAITIKGCYNSGTISGTDNVGGMLGGMQEYNVNGINSDHTITVSECLNDGKIYATGAYAGGMIATIGSVTEGCELEVVVERCYNRGDVTADGQGAAGMVAQYNNGRTTETLTVSQCVNEGAISSGFGKNDKGATKNGNAGGILGIVYASNSAVTVQECANLGTVAACEWNTFGIWGQVNHGGADVSNQMNVIKNCVNVGELKSNVAGGAKENPIGASMQVNENNFYVKNSVEKDYSEFGVISEADAKKMIAKYTLFVTDASALKDAMAEAKTYLDNAEEYDALTIKSLQAHYTDAQNILDNAPIGIAKNADGMYTMYVVNNSAIENAIAALKGNEGIGGLAPKGELWMALEKIVAEADVFIAEEAGLYTDETWKEFLAIYDNAKSVLKMSNIRAEENYQTVYGALVNLRTAMKSLREDLTLKGKVIYTAEEFAMLDGQNGNFSLGADITISEPLKSFGGNLNGNGFTITLDGTALFEELAAAMPTGRYNFDYAEMESSISNVNIAGDAGDAKSVFGKATGIINVDNVIIEVPTLGVASIFHEAGDNTEITVANVLTTAAAKYAVLGDMNCKVVIDTVIAMGKADALVGAATKLKATTAYLDGVEYYDKNATLANGAMASGELAVTFNKIFAELGETNAKFASYNFVQNLGTDAKPYFGTVSADKNNQVVWDETTKTYVNANVSYFDPTIVIPELDTTVPVVYTMLQAALARAGSLAEADYTAESWALLQAAIEAGNEALKSTDQDAVDEAVGVINVILASMEKKTSGLDYSALIAALDAAAKLTRGDYTSGSWATFQAILTMAKVARLSDSQSAIDSAVASLKTAVDGLVKVEKTDADVDSDKDNEPTDDGEEPTEEPAGPNVIVIVAIAVGAALVVAACVCVVIILVKKKAKRAALGAAAAGAIDAGADTND